MGVLSFFEVLRMADCSAGFAEVDSRPWKVERKERNG
jgi:hypothetical protein